jgi:hypothetical protein
LCRNGIWYDTLIIEEDPTNKIHTKIGVFISLIDNKTKKYLAKFILPSEKMIPGEQYLYLLPYLISHLSSPLALFVFAELPRFDLIYSLF